MLLKCPLISSKEKREKQDRDERSSHPNLTLASDANQLSSNVTGKRQHDEDRKRKHIDTKELGTLAKYKAGQSSEPNLTWVHIAPILSPRKACPSHEGTAAAGRIENQPLSAVPQPSRQGSPATQDSSISSTTPYKHPKHQKKPIQCQSQPVAGQQGESEKTETCQGQNQSPHVKLKPLPRVCPTPLET